MMKKTIIIILLLAFTISCQHLRENRTAASRTPIVSDDETIVLTPEEAKEIFDCTVVDVERKISAAGPLFSFRLVQEYSFHDCLYRIEIRSKTGDIFQTLNFRNSFLLQKADFEVVDVDADKFLDVRVVGGIDKSGKKWYKSWRYSGETRSYVRMKE